MSKVKFTTFELYLDIIDLLIQGKPVEIIFLLQNLCYTEIALKSNLGVQQGSPMSPAI